MELPVNITRAGSARVTLPGFTRNISSSGVLFTSGASPDLGGPIEYVITINHDGGRPINLRCMGKVVRSQEMHGEDRRSFQIAATLERYEFLRERVS